MEDHDRIADQGEETADQLQELSGNLERDIRETKEDWDSKKQTESVPGAMELPEDRETDEDDDEDRTYGEATGTEHVTPETADASGGRAQESDEEAEDSDDSKDDGNG